MRGQEDERARGKGGAQEVQEGKRCSGHLGTHEDRYHLLNENLVLNGPGGHRRCKKKVTDGEDNMFHRCCFKKSESQVDLPIVTRPTLDSREGLMRIMQREMRQVMVFKRMKEKSRSSREVVPGQEEIRLSEMVGTCTY